MTRHYCTYFDSRYLARAAALFDSLSRHDEDFVLHALCLDQAAHAALMRLAIPNLRPISLRQLEDAYPALLRAKSNRNPVEYYFTCTPALPLYALDHAPGGPKDSVTYLDADLYFFSSPRAIFDELDSREGSVAIIEHRYPPTLTRLEINGKFNVGMVVFRNDGRGRACLRWWHERCLEWCYDRHEAGRYADQGYLDEFPRRFEGVVSIRHRGANVAPWNLAGSTITLEDERVCINGDPLVFYHFHRLKILGPHLFDPGLEHYGVAPDPLVTRHIYGPYLSELRRLMRQLPMATRDNLRLTTPRSGREVARLLVYGRPMVSVGPVVTEVHGEPWVRPLLRLREATLRLTGRRKAA